MKKYKVKSLVVIGLSGEKYRTGDVVTENRFEPGHADKLVDQGHLTPEGKPEKQETKKPEAKNEKAPGKDKS